jgi:hypothetical protein
MPFAWAYLDEGGSEAGRSDPFPDREAAEEWMGTAWEDLLEHGHHEVELLDLERDRRVYRMGLGDE